MNINISFDSSVQNAPAGFQNAVLTAAQIIDAALTDNITINIAVGYGEINGTMLTKQNGAEGNVAGGNLFSYSQVRTLLSNGASAGDTTFASLPSGSSVQGQAQVAVWFAEQKALGLRAANNPAIDGEIGIGTGVPSSLWVGVALHEIGHAMGRVPDGPPNSQQPDIFDLFRFTAPGTNLFASGNTAGPAYFSTDGGFTNRADYGQTSDPSDFLNASGRTPEDTVNEFFDFGTIQGLTAVDLEQFDALGFHLAKPVYAGLTKEDLNFSHTADILWRGASGGLVDWDMEGGAVDSGNFLTSNGAIVTPDASWSVAGISDFNNDGDADLLWRDSNTGQLAEWLMNGNVLTASTALKSNSVTVNPDLSWTTQAKPTTFA